MEARCLFNLSKRWTHSHIKLIPYKSEHLLKSVPARQKNNKQIETGWNNTSINSIIVTYWFIL